LFWPHPFGQEPDANQHIAATGKVNSENWKKTLWVLLAMLEGAVSITQQAPSRQDGQYSTRRQPAKTGALFSLIAVLA
jgi:hypothetical protein